MCGSFIGSVGFVNLVVGIYGLSRYGSQAHEQMVGLGLLSGSVGRYARDWEVAANPVELINAL
jgi:hypothetical protein